MAKRPLRILQVNTADKPGGAARIAWNLFTAYRARGHYSRLAVGTKRSDDPDVQIIPNQTSYGRWHDFFHKLSESNSGPETPLNHLAGILAEPVRRLDYYRGIEDFHFPGTAHLLKLDEQLPDILHAHNLHGAYFDLRQLPQLSQQVPLVLTLHDAWLLSGHCAHSFDCEKWQSGCGDCPDLTIYPPIERDGTADNWRRKRAIFAQSRLYVATPCQWLRQKVEASMLATAVVEAKVIPNGVDLNIFQPGDRQEARAKLAIPQETIVLLTSGVQVRESIWRDFAMLTEAVAQVAELLEGQKVLLIALGQAAPPTQYGSASVWSIPFQEDDEDIARYYQAADLYLHIARADTFPTTIIEAMACGIPVVATAVGGIPEQVKEGHTGFLVPPGDVITLAERIKQIVCDLELKRGMEKQAVTIAQQKYSLTQQVESYLAWYAQMKLAREKAAQKILL